jgi:hypothetical protein
MRAMEVMFEQVPATDRPAWVAIRNINRYPYSGNAADLTLLDATAVPEGLSAAVMLVENLRVLRLQHRYEEILQLLSRQPGPILPTAGLFECFTLASRPSPVALVRGWTRMLRGEREAAQADGREALQRIRPASPSDWEWQLLAAEAAALAGDDATAIAAAREAMVLMPRSRFALRGAYAAWRAAIVLSWAGQPEEAISLLEDISTATPGVSPGNITREPLFVTALGEHPRFKALTARLEARMAATPP